MLKLNRQQRILDQVTSNSQRTVEELSHHFGVSEVTIRRDLRELAEQGLLERVHGGAVATGPSLQEPPVVRRMREARACKKRIARAAADLIPDGTSVFIGSGSTTTYVARCLHGRKNLTVVTNALTVATELADADGITTVVTGGMMRGPELSLVGHIAQQALQEVRISRAIIGIPAIDVRAGLTNDYLPEVETDREIIGMTPELILVADHTKFGRVGTAYVAPVAKIGTLVTDSQAPLDVLDQIRAMNVRVITVDIEREE